MLLGLAFIPEADVRTTFNTLRRDCPEDLLPVLTILKNITLLAGLQEHNGQLQRRDSQFPRGTSMTPP